jgi:cell wall-associated NlpC family hydrolase
VGAVYRDVYRQDIPRTTSELNKASKSVSQKQLKEGDLVFFDIDGKKNAHVGVYLINNKFVHASSSKGVIVSDLMNPYYKKAFARGGKL